MILIHVICIGPISQKKFDLKNCKDQWKIDYGEHYSDRLYNVLLDCVINEAGQVITYLLDHQMVTSDQVQICKDRMNLMSYLFVYLIKDILFKKMIFNCIGLYIETIIS